MAKTEHISGRMINGEYWSNEALEEKPVEQLYPQLEDEPTEEYERRIGEIAAIMSEDDSTPAKLLAPLMKPSKNVFLRKLATLHFVMQLIQN